MKKVLVNSCLSILFSLVIVLSIGCLTLLNDNFIIHVLKNNDVYESIYKDMDEYIMFNYEDCTLDKNILYKDIDRYIKSYYNISKIKGSITCVEEKDLSNVYKKIISIKGLDKINHRLIYYGTFIVTIILVIIIGSIFIKFKKNHNIFDIFIYSFPILITAYGCLYIFIDFNIEILNMIYYAALHYLLGTSIILFEIGVFKKIKTRLKK